MNKVIDLKDARRPAAFDYCSLPNKDTAKELRDAAQRIRKIGRQSVIDIGRELIKVKSKLGRGKFGSWLQVEFEISERTAENYMSAAHLARDNPEIISALKPAALYLLSAPSTPSEIRDEALERARAGKAPDIGTIRMAIAEARVAKREATKEASLSKQAKQRRAKQREQRKREQEEWRRERERREAEADQSFVNIVELLAARLSADVLKHMADQAAKLDFHHTLAAIVKAALARNATDRR